MVASRSHADKLGPSTRAGRWGTLVGVLLARHLARLVGGSLAYATATRRVSLLVVLVVGLVLVALGLAAKAAAPVVIYPFI
jgi:hypothetical protein